MEHVFALVNNSLYWKYGISLLIIILTCVEILIFSKKNCRLKSDYIRNNMSGGGGKLVYISALNVFSAIGVVILHANGIFWSRPTGVLWLSSNFIETFFYWPVPIFFMMTGATLIGYLRRYNTSVFFLKRFTKTFLPFIFWSLFACAFCTLYEGRAMDWNILHIVSNIFNAQYQGVYWFFPALFSIYLSIPLLALVTNKLRAFQYVIIIGLVTNLAIPLLCNIINVPFNIRLKLDIAGGSLLYALSGYYLSRTDFTQKWRIIIYICGFAGWLIHYFGTLISSAEQTFIVGTFKGYDNLPAFVQAVAVFVFFKYFFGKHQIYEQIKTLLVQTSGLTFGIYLIHMYFLNILHRELSIDTGSLMWRIVGGLFVFCLSAHVIVIVKKIPFLKRVVP